MWTVSVDEGRVFDDRSEEAISSSPQDLSPARMDRLEVG